jgi:nucleotide-binding universal stress UspA family protein
MDQGSEMGALSASSRHLPLPREQSQPVWVMADGTYESAEAVAWAAQLASTASVPLVVVRTWNAWIGELRPAAHDAVERRLRKELGSWAKPATELGIQPRLVLAEGEPGVVVPARAAADHAALVVVADTMKTALSGLLANSKVPIATVPVAGAARPVRRILLALDGSASSDAACWWTAALAARTRSVVHAATVFEPVAEWVPPSDPTSMMGRVRAGLNGAWTAPLRAAGVEVVTEVIEGFDALGALVRVSRQHRDDLVVVGHDHGSHDLWRSPFGRRAVDATGLPVVLVPEAA